MGIDINQWRCAIGCFCPRQSHELFHISPSLKNNTQKEHFDLRHFMLFFTLLVIYGCIEKNPGPVTNVSVFTFGCG